MPPLKTHCAISKKRTGNDFAELHRWIDEPTRGLGYEHRMARHYLNEEDKNTIKGRWGEKALIEWLFHIALDNLSTAFKMSKQWFSYGDKTYNFMEFGLNKSGYIHCNFRTVEEHELQYIFDDEPEENYWF